MAVIFPFSICALIVYLLEPLPPSRTISKRAGIVIFCTVVPSSNLSVVAFKTVPNCHVIPLRLLDKAFHAYISIHRLLLPRQHQEN